MGFRATGPICSVVPGPVRFVPESNAAGLTASSPLNQLARPAVETIYAFGGTTSFVTGDGDESEQPIDLLAAYERAINVHELACAARTELSASNDADRLALARASVEVSRAARAVTTTRAAFRAMPESRIDGQRAVNIATGMLMDRLTITPDAALALLVEASVSSSRTLADLAISSVASG